MPGRTGPSRHLEPVMGTVVGITSDHALPERGLHDAIASLHEADRVFSTWDATSPLSRLRSGRIAPEDLDTDDLGLVAEVLERCAWARERTGGAFDPWSLPGGADPTGLVKGWAAHRALDALVAAGARDVMVNAGGDVAVSTRRDGQPWRVGVRHPAQPGALVAVLDVTSAVATSGDYERPGQLLDPRTRRAARVVASATVVGPDLDRADALATGLAVGGRDVLERIEGLEDYEALLVTYKGRCLGTRGLPVATASPAA
jgi:FAD:protein FMN transferase